MYLLFIYNFIQLHQEKECPAYPVVCEKCKRDEVPRAKVELQTTVMWRTTFFFRQIQSIDSYLFLVTVTQHLIPVISDRQRTDTYEYHLIDCNNLRSFSLINLVVNCEMAVLILTYSIHTYCISSNK